MRQETNGESRRRPQTPKERLKEILSGKARIGNLDAYFDEAIGKLTVLISETRSAYEAGTSYDASLPTRDQEDKAFEAAGLPNVTSVLDTLIRKRSAYQALRLVIGEQEPDPHLVFLPGNGETAIRGDRRPKQGTREEVERADALAFVLAELGLTEADIGGALTGAKEEGTKRRGYTVVDLPSLNRAILVNDEHAQATYVIDTRALGTLSPPLTLEDVIRLSKEELRRLLYENKDKGIGTWLRFTEESWMERLKEALTAPEIGKEDIRVPDEGTYQVYTNGPWEGFADIGDLHYGTPEVIRKRLRNEEKREESLPLVGSVCKKLQSVLISDPRTTPRAKELGYAYEEFLTALAARDELPKANRETGIALVGPDKVPYMSLDVLAKHLERSQDAIETLVEKHKVPTIDMVDRYNRETKGYPIERLRDLSRLTMSKPPVESLGTETIPKGFILKDGVLYGLVKEISRQLSVSESSINQAIHEAKDSETPLPSLEVRDYSNNPRTAYSLPAIESHPTVARILKAENADADGWLRRDGKTYGTIPKIAAEVLKEGLATITVKQLRNNLGYLARRRGLFEGRPARIPDVRPVQDVYCLEDILAYYRANQSN